MVKAATSSRKEKEAGCLLSLQNIINAETDRIRKLTLSLIDMPDVAGDIRVLITEASERRSKAQAELNEISGGAGCDGEFRLNFELLESAKELIRGWLEIELSSSKLESSQVKAMHTLLEAFDFLVNLYPER